MTGAESLKNFMQNEGVSQKDICDILKVPASRVSEWCNFTRNCTAVVILDCWEMDGQKKTAFRLPIRGEVSGMQFEGLETATNQKMYIGSGIWGIVKLFYFRNRFLSGG